MREDRPAWWVWTGSATIPILGLAGGLLALSRTSTDLRWMLGMAVAVAVGTIVRVPTRHGMHRTVGYLAVAAMPAISADSGRPTFDLAASLGTIALGMGISWVLHTARGGDQRRILADSLRRWLAFSSYVAVYTLVSPSGLAGSIGEWAEIAVTGMAAAAAFLTESATSPWARIGSRHTTRLTSADLEVFVALVSTGALFGLTFQVLSWWSLAVAGLPYAFAHSALRRFGQTRTTYDQTIRALAQIPEAGGHVPEGHSLRTAELALAMAHTVGMRAAAARTVEYAALMHDVGMVTLNEPGVIRRGYTENDVAGWGAEIVQEAGMGAEVAEAVRRQHEPYRNPGEPRAPDVPMASRIVKVASAYDQTVTEKSATPLEAVETLHRGSVYDYDPEVVSALRRVVEGTVSFAGPPDPP